MRRRYEVYCDGRLLKVTEQVPGTVRQGVPVTYSDSSVHEWRVDDARVPDDVANALIEKYERDHPGKSANGNMRVEPPR